MILIVKTYLFINFINTFELKNYTLQNAHLNQREKRAVMQDPRYIWNTQKFLYYVGRRLKGYVIALAHIKIKRYTCLRFYRVLNKKKAHIIYKEGPMYVTYLGKQDKGQHRIFIPSKHIHYGKVARETLRALGFDYEHNRPDRDMFLSIVKSNIHEAYLPFFAEKSLTLVNTYGLSYDYRSIMHYGSRELCLYGTRCITSKNNDLLVDSVMGKAKDLTFNDAKLVNLAYCLSLIAVRRGKCLNFGYLTGIVTTKCRCLPYFDGNRCEYFIKNFDYCTRYNVFYAKKQLLKVTLQAQKNCYYYIQVKKGKKIILYIGFTDYVLKHPICDDSQHIEVRYRNDFSVSGKMICPRKIFYTFKSESNVIILHTKYDIKHYNFTIFYKEL
uniref:Metalloendopeptidase n=1 Tax=Strongyloides papillosus TaxID=174720 RepID=A0A0N5BLM7_STREA